MKKFLVSVLCLSIAACFCGCESAKPDSSEAKNEPEITEIIQDDNQEPAESPDDMVQNDNPSDGEPLSSEELEKALSQKFLEVIESSGNMKETAEQINIASQMNLVTEDCTEGFLPGFNADITGFKSGVKLQPMIGSIPFAAYIFETDDTAALLEKLNSAADPRWNICTEARNPVTQVSGNYVFFLMVPAE